MVQTLFISEFSIVFLWRANGGKNEQQTKKLNGGKFRRTGKGSELLTTVVCIDDSSLYSGTLGNYCSDTTMAGTSVLTALDSGR